MALYTAPKDAEELERRKVLAASLKELAASPEQSPETGKGLMEEAKKIGLTENNVKDLYDQYANPKPNAEEKPAPIGTQPVTRLLDRYDEMQRSPTGTFGLSAPPRSLESDSGKAFRMARKLGRMGFGQAGAQLAAMGAAKKLAGEPSIRNQAYIDLNEKAKRAAISEAEADADFKKKQRDTLNRILDQQNKDLDSGTFDYTKYANTTNG